MRAIFETLFDIFYLLTVLSVGIRMIRNSEGSAQFQLFGWMAVVLGAGIPSIWCPAHWLCAPPALTVTLSSWVWASGSPRSP